MRLKKLNKLVREYYKRYSPFKSPLIVETKEENNKMLIATQAMKVPPDYSIKVLALEYLDQVVQEEYNMISTILEDCSVSLLGTPKKKYQYKNYSYDNPLLELRWVKPITCEYKDGLLYIEEIVAFNKVSPKNFYLLRDVCELKN